MSIELQWHDLAWCLRRAPKKVLEVMKLDPTRVIVAGGFIRSCVANEPINDIDLFAPDQSTAFELANILAPDQDRSKDEKGLLPGIHWSENALTIRSLKPTVQIIHRWTFNSPTDCISSFDFTVARAAFWWNGDKWMSEVSPSFYPDLAAKRLIYCSPKRIEEAGGSMLRVLKFYQRGYRIPLDSLSDVIARLVGGIDFGKTGASEERISHVICGLLREVDPNVDPDHLSHLPSKPQEEEAVP